MINSRINWQQIKNGPWVTYLFLTIQIAVFLLMTITGLMRGYGLSGSYDGNILIEFGASSPTLMVYFNEYWRLITPIFVHIGWTHLLFNSIFLYFAGKDLETLMGHLWFFIFYMLSGFGGNLFSFAFARSESISAGASTSLFGIFGAFIAFGVIYRYHPQIQHMARNMLTLAVFNIVLNLFSSGVDILGHIGGLLSGLLLGFAITAPALKNSRYNIIEEDNVHRRIVSAIGYVLFIGFMIVYAVRKYHIQF